jgi:phosphatidate cytidylyltransferase
MASREATAFAILPVVLAAIVFLPPWVYLTVVWGVTEMAAWELLVLLRKLGYPVPHWATLVAIGAALPAVWFWGLAVGTAVSASLILLLPLAFLFGRFPIQGASAGIAGAAFTALYFAITGGAMGLLRISFPEPLGWKVVLLYCLTIWGGDSGAYYLGTRLGRHKLAPRVSPNKSWEGVLGGTVLTFFAVWFCRTVFPFAELQAWAGWVLAGLLSVLAPLGDLVESLFKRDAGVKDSSDLIPGHGGFLDRTDSLFYAAPFVLALMLAVLERV